MFSDSTIANPTSQYNFKLKSLREPHDVTYFIFTNKRQEKHLPERLQQTAQYPASKSLPFQDKVTSSCHLRLHITHINHYLQGLSRQMYLRAGGEYCAKALKGSNPKQWCLCGWRPDQTITEVNGSLFDDFQGCWMTATIHYKAVSLTL